MPFALASNRNRPTPLRSRRLPDARALTISLSALAPPRTTHFSPSISHVAAPAVGARRRRRVGKIVARLPFLMRKCERQVAFYDGRYELGQQGGVTGMAQGTATQYYGGKVGLDGKGAPDASHDDHGLGQALPKTTMRFREGNAQQAKFGILLPELCGVALRLFHVAAALIEIAIAVEEQTIHAFLELPLLVVEIEIHYHPPGRLSVVGAGRHWTLRTLAAARPAPINRLPPTRLKIPMARWFCTSPRARDAISP